MSDRGKLTVPYNTSDSQARASDPLRSIWVEANAGSGKTYVLTRRVLRLLLAGVRPQSILCLTYTKAAAAEMRGRVGRELARWAVVERHELASEIAGLTGAAPDEVVLEKARTLFARALETPGGLRILTIHAFCEAVLHRFPIEAGVPFDFKVIEDDQRNAMVLAARETVLAEGLRGGANAVAVETLFALMTDTAIKDAIDAALVEGARLKPVLVDVAAARRRLQALVGPVGTLEAITARFTSETLLGPGVLARLVECLKGSPEGSRRCVDLLARLDPQALTQAGLRAAFFTAEDKPRAGLMTKKEIEAFPELYELLVAEQERLLALQTELAGAYLLDRSFAVLDVVAAVHARYEAEKRGHALLDFDDLIEKLGDLFDNRAIAPWVQYKLDAGIDHILVDESQDTNAQQWRVVKALAEEFFTGAGAVTRPRSIFAVGDQKQSIYSFQGAQPILFGTAGRDFAQRARQAMQLFEQVKLHTSFRTLSGILAAVDLVCARPDIQKALLAEDKVGHEAARIQPGGLVSLWPPIAPLDAAASDGEWPRKPLDAEPSAQRLVAQRIAREIRSWVDTQRPLAQRGRAVRADDVLILVQKRGPFFQEIIRALRLENLPTPGADRLAVTGHIAVLDLLALMDVLLNPAENLQLAALLRSPLFDVSEDDLYRLSEGRAPGETLWQRLMASDLSSAQEAAGRLRAWRAELDFERPFEFLASVLYAGGGLRRFHARLGTEVDEVLSEILALALAHEQTEQPSLQGFAAELRRRSVTIKRELTEAGNGVRVMTVHGAKGLEAPIVILADAVAKPSTQQTGKPVYVVPDHPGPLLIHAQRAEQHVPQTADIKNEIDGNQAEEYWRRLYVAMTRAEDELYVTGAFSERGKPETQLVGSWYEAIDMALAPSGERLDDGTLVYPQARPEPLAIEKNEVKTIAYAPVALPEAVPAPKEKPVISPSRAGIARPQVLESLAEQVRDAEAARKSGLALHALLQHLGRIDPADWERVVPRALETLLPDHGHEHDRILNKALTILRRPELGRLFGPGSRAEVPFLVEARRRGEAVRLSGRMDRLVVDEEGVLVVDYKSDANAPNRVADVPARYFTQLGLYALVAGQLFPGRPISAAILWTELESLMNLPATLLAEARADFTLL
ncbi:ATP-dependent helicase/nuclease subunit A [Devosia equisanguinis]|uniref:DNA 3'-5' helicase n=1 Tax=Devosia equisanguinis TaxID=2490941 RepID=A0A3S4CBG8_9HYPH|nr:double-strand break repair helicase AddA [Devosia equisanguinis]VDS03363.1 ATP-dependent helicase/nuclease subunit A [Devosia equisanguinis]